jgi:hypothetical protein
MSNGKKDEIKLNVFWPLHVQSYFAKIEKENDSKDLQISRPDGKETEHDTGIG